MEQRQEQTEGEQDEGFQSALLACLEEIFLLPAILHPLGLAGEQYC